MNDEARQELDRILAIEPAALTESEQAFLAARRDYLTEEQRVNFGLTETASPSDDEAALEDSVQARKSKSK